MRSAMKQAPRSRSALVLALALTGILGTPVHGADVFSIGDGDTITVKEQGSKVKVRLACIDAPETSQRPYGLQSRDALRALLPIGSSVSLKVKTKDRYGRTVAEIYKGSRNLNQTLVGQGQAFVYWQYISGCDRQRYGQLEKDARLKRLGVWSVAGGIQKPWDYRRGRKAGGGGSSAGHSPSPSKRRWKCSEVGSWQQAQDLLKQGHTYLDGDKDGEACESLR